MNLEDLYETIEKQQKLIIMLRQEIDMYKAINKSMEKEYKKKAKVVFDEILSYVGKR